jgi:hypothetical protein
LNSEVVVLPPKILLFIEIFSTNTQSYHRPFSSVFDSSR